LIFFNEIQVGAGESYGPDLQPGMLGPSYVADFSSKGPTPDGRTKPDIIAPGKFITSAAPGDCDLTDGSIPRASFERIEGLASNAGTSMATPVISGSLAIIRQYFRDGFYPTGKRNQMDGMENPSGALLKAVLLNGGQQMIAVDNQFTSPRVFSSVPYDNIQNFGRASLIDSLYLEDANNAHLLVWDREKIRESETKIFSVAIDHSERCKSNLFSATLVWMDKPGFPFCVESCLMNDLDLHVTINDIDGMIFANGRQTRDNRNTAERVRLNTVTHGDIINMHVDGFSFESLDDIQQFALVATGCFGSGDDESERRSKIKKRGKNKNGRKQYRHQD